MIHARRVKLAHATLAAFAIAILVKSANVQLVNGRMWREIAQRQQTSARTVPAPRGEILDATHRVFAQSEEKVRLEIAPREVNEPGKLRRALIKLRLDRALIARALDTSTKYLTIPGRFPASDAADATSLRGVHSFTTITRAYATSRGAQGIVGHVDGDNKPVDGLELSLDSILRGTPGAATIYRDLKGQSRESPIAPGTQPVKGNSVVLTINADLQEIAEKSLAEAVAKMGAEGGDIVIVDPHDGEVLAMASRRLDPRQTSATALTDPFEPGSTAKPFMAAGLLEHGLVSETDSVDTGDGVYTINGRDIHDEHLVGRAPLAEVLRWSSNIGIVKFASRMSDRQTFETLRDFGFGTATGVPFPTESNGVLRSPAAWSKQSANSLAMGYEVAVTPLQLAMAYAALANGGELVEPALIKEIIGPDGSIRYRHSRRVVRRVVSRPVADKVRHMLIDVVDEGTALESALDNYILAGKTGTPRGSVRGHYVAGRYNPNFASLFPGDAPQYVIVVKLTAPQSSIFAAKTAAPVTKAILEAAIAARDAALDRGKLASSVLPPKKDTSHPAPSQLVGLRPSEDSSGVVAGAASPVSTSAVAPAPTALPVVPSAPVVEPGAKDGTVPFVVTLPLPAPAAVPRVVKPVPDVRGLNIRDAVRSLHSAGFHVLLAHGVPAAGSVTSPAAGEMASTGTLVRLHVDY